MNFSVRRLGADDAALYRDIRLTALSEEPTAFGSDVATESGQSLRDWSARLDRVFTFGAFDRDGLQGTATYFPEERMKLAHRGMVVGVYVRPQVRGRGAAQALFATLIADAQTRVKQLHLSVTAGNETARLLYERIGFQIYGTEPRALYVDGRYYDEHLMMLPLDGGQRKVTTDE
ncbi:MAG TPA: GNAT family N-acetyltransferase [Devosiaceae bacterium]|nr:GNAT family N-acetyltransferase [Devosiaceae bacterium]